MTPCKYQKPVDVKITAAQVLLLKHITTDYLHKYEWHDNDEEPDDGLYESVKHLAWILDDIIEKEVK